VAPSFGRAPSVGVAPTETNLLYRVSAFGGVATPVVTLDKAAGEMAQSWPQFLPDGKHFLYFSRNQNTEKSVTYVQQLGSIDRRLLLTNPIRAGYAPPGHLLFISHRTLFAQSFDSKTFQLQEEPISIAESRRLPTAVGLVR
jgi:eukaryotic-like serine/threonine-protein kinase